MHALAIDGLDMPTTFAYLDSGAPNCETYTTLVVLHGLTFHSGVFQRILPLATSKRLRLICINRRDYQGSSPYSPSELKVLSEGDEGERAAFLTDRGVELALFLDLLIKKLSLPKPNPNGDEGGLALMGWSLGNVFTIAVLAAVSSLPPETRFRLQEYMRRLILLEPPANSLGIPFHVQERRPAYVPFFDDSIPQEERAPAFSHWIVQYFTHGDLSKRDYSTIEHRNPDPSRKAAATEEDLALMTDYIPAFRSEFFLCTSFGTSIFEQTSKLLLDPEFSVSMWPQMKIWLIHCDSTAWPMIHGVWGIEKLLEANNKERVRFLMIEDAHHAVFWDEPERALDAFGHCLRH